MCIDQTISDSSSTPFLSQLYVLCLSVHRVHLVLSVVCVGEWPSAAARRAYQGMHLLIKPIPPLTAIFNYLCSYNLSTLHH